MAAKFETESQSVGKGWNWIATRHLGDGTAYFEGTVVAPEGIVEVYSDLSGTVMRFVWNGRIYDRRWNQRFSPQGLSRLAKALAKEISTNN